MAGAEEVTLPRDLVFVDLETTGANAAFHRITEIGIVRMRDGVVVEEWSSLVNPECHVPSYIEDFTGITNEMVANAPRFGEIAALVLEKLQSPMGGECESTQPPVFVAHNARFDYSFLRAEFRRTAIAFCAKVVCTVKLSRRLFPEFTHHNLDAVMQRHQLLCSARHRALGDARVLADLWRKLLAEQPPETFGTAVHDVLQAHQLPSYLPEGLADELPDGPGVYRFFDGDGVLLYVGRSASLRTRILDEFAGAGAVDALSQKARQVRNIDWCETAGVLGAQLMEAAWIRHQKPLYNKRSKQPLDSVTLKPLPQPPGFQIATISDLDPADLPGCFGVFHSWRDARKALVDIARARSLCLKVLGLEEGGAAPPTVQSAVRGTSGAGSCLAYQVGRCKGACLGEEPMLLHNVRLHMALSSLRLKPWPFPGRIGVREGFAETHVLDHWVYLGTARTEDELLELAARPAQAGFDVDVYRILLRYLAKNPDLQWHDLRAKSVCP
jgi:DNA polymerase III subunit epsilon